MDGTENEENKAPEAGETQPEVVPETDTAVAPPLGEATPAEPATETAPEPTEEAPADNANLAVGDKDGQADENKDGDDESSRQKEGVKEETKIVAEDGEKKEETDKEETADADNKTVESVQEVSDEKEKEEGGGDDGGVKETSESKEEEKEGKEGEGGEEEEKKSEEVEGEKKKEEDEVQAADQDNQGEVSPPIVEKTDDKKEDDADKPSSDETKKEGEAEPAAEPATEPVVAEGEGQPEAAAEGQTAQEEEPKTEAPKAEEDAEKKSDETDAAAAEEKPAEESQPKEEVKEGEEGEKVEAKPEEGEKVEAKPEEGEKVEAKPEEGEKVEVKPEEGEKVEATPEEGEKGDEKEEKKEGDEKKDDEGENATVEKAATDEDKVDGEEKKDEEKEEGGDDAEEKKEEGEAEEEGEGVDGEKKEEEDEDLLDPDFYYEFEEHVSKAVVAQDSGLPLDMLALQHSYGYDCKRRNNLLLMDEKTVVFAAGNLIQILDLVSKEQKYLRSTSGCGIGAIAVHPSRKYFAVGEKGETPNINIFEFPSLKLYRILRGGTESSYTSLTYSPDGELLASQGGEPDFMLTLWNWRQEKTTLRTKSFSQDVFKVSFAPELEGQLTTAGSGHIRFWKMADTFTGLKLQGELGRFGRTEISDIEGYVELPDGKVLSGAEWGNLLLWEGGLIKVEITRKGKKSCHKGPIMQILLDEGELMTVGMDGYIRVWDFESIDTADSSDDSGRFEMDPMNELSVASNVQLNTIVKSVDEEKEPTIWYSQDANGGIWKLDLSFSHTSQAPEKMFTYHSGRISGCVTSPLSHIAVTAGIDSTVRVYDYMQQKQLTEAKFSAGSTCILWAPLLLDPKASTVVTGYNDGVVRILSINQLDDDLARKADKHDVEIALKQTFKPHKAMVTAMAFDGKGEMLATGSSDGTVFFLFASVSNFEPIGFVQVSSAVRQLVWTPEKFKHTGLMVVCEDGQVLEIEAPEPGNFDTSHSFEINGLPMKSYQFKSIKSHLRHEEELERLRIEEEERKRKEEEERKKRIERGLETESEQGDEEGGRPRNMAAHTDSDKDSERRTPLYFSGLSAGRSVVPECELIVDGEGDLGTMFDNCPKQFGHKNFIPVKGFTADNLPEQMRTDAVMKEIRERINRTVLIRIAYTSVHRPETFFDSKTPYPYCRFKGSRRAVRIGTGTIVRYVPFRRVNGDCPCHLCKKSGNHEKKYWQFHVLTATHVLFDDSEAGQSVAQCFYDSPEDRDGVVTLYGVKIDSGISRDEMHRSDFCDKVQYVTHDEASAWRIINTIGVGSNYPYGVRPQGGFIVSHPHGRSKVISIGKNLFITAPIEPRYAIGRRELLPRRVICHFPSECSNNGDDDKTLSTTSGSSAVPEPRSSISLPRGTTFTLPANAEYAMIQFCDRKRFTSFPPGTAFHSEEGGTAIPIPDNAEFDIYLNFMEEGAQYSVAYDMATCPGSSGAIVSCFWADCENIYCLIPHCGWDSQENCNRSGISCTHSVHSD